MLSKDEYDKLRDEELDVWSQLQDVSSEANSERKSLTDQTKSAIETTLKQVDDPTLLHHKLGEIVDQHTHHIVQSANHFQQHITRMHVRLSEIFKEIDRHVNHAFMWGFNHAMGRDNPHGNRIHWDIYFRHNKFNEHSRVIFLRPDEDTWTFDNGAQMSIDDMDEQKMIAGYNTIHWLEAYAAEHDTLIFKLIG